MRLKSDNDGAKLAMMKHKQFKVKHGIYPKLQIASLLQVPLHMMHFGLIHSIASNSEHIFHAAMSTGGGLWFENLLIPDPYGALPCISAVL